MSSGMEVMIGKRVAKLSIAAEAKSSETKTEQIDNRKSSSEMGGGETSRLPISSVYLDPSVYTGIESEVLERKEWNT